MTHRAPDRGLDPTAVARARERAQRVHGAAQEERARGRWGEGGTYTVGTRQGAVELAGVTYHEADGVAWVEVRVAGATESGEPHYRIFNPPTLVEDPEGSVELRGKRWTLDPLRAVAEAVAASGGRKQKGRRR